MQTFLPWPDFKMSAKSLDNKRLNKQRLEGLQLLQALADRTTDTNEFAGKYPPSVLWHPACMMWYGHERALGRYVAAMCVEYTRRGFRDNYEMQVVELVQRIWPDSNPDVPSWFGLTVLHENHRSRLLQKENAWYQKQDFGPMPSAWGNLWPITKTHGKWVYMMNGYVVSRIADEPVHRLATHNKVQCGFCNFWWNIGDVIDLLCPICTSQKENIELITTLRAGLAVEERALGDELLGHVTKIIHLTRAGRL